MKTDIILTSTRMAASRSLKEDLQMLLDDINALLGSYQMACRDGLLTKHFAPEQTRGDNPRPVFPPGKAYQVFNAKWENIFQTDERASMTAETIAVDVVTKEWLKSGLTDGVD